MKYAITNSCGKRRGCTVVITLPYDRRPGAILSKMHGACYDLSTVLSLVNIDLDKKPEKKRSVEKVAA